MHACVQRLVSMHMSPGSVRRENLKITTPQKQWTHLVLVIFSSKKNQGSLEKWLILWEQEIYKVTLEHPVASERKTMFQKTEQQQQTPHNDGSMLRRYRNPLKAGWARKLSNMMYTPSRKYKYPWVHSDINKQLNEEQANLPGRIPNNVCSSCLLSVGCA